MTNKLVTADAAKLLVDGGVRRIYRADSHIGEQRGGGGEERERDSSRVRKG